MKLFAVVILGLFFSSCGTLEVKSTPPEVEVGLMLPGKETVKVLGKTPYTASASEMEDISNEGTVVLVLRKPGYIDQHFVIPNISGNIAIEANLSPNLPSNYREINRIVALVLKGQKMIIDKRFDDLFKITSEIKKINENIASAYELDGAAYFLKKDLKNSRFAWIKVLELNPNNPEAQNMLALIEKKLGIK